MVTAQTGSGAGWKTGEIMGEKIGKGSRKRQVY
jgi:hypothetical protein